jgi:hypothetical protein
MDKKGNKNILYSGLNVPETTFNGLSTLLLLHRAL